MATLRHDRFALRLLATLLPVALLAGIFALVHADTPAESEPARAIVHQSRSPHPVAAAAADLYRRQELRLADLRAAIDSASDPDAVLRLEREYQRVKLQTELDFLRLQLEHARNTGNVAASASLEEAVIAMERLVDREAGARITDGSADRR